MKGRRFSVRCVLLPLLVAGCKAVGPDYAAPSSVLPAAWRGSEPAAAERRPDEALGRWWSTLRDPVLADLVAVAQTNNLDVAQAEARLRKARAERRVSRAGLFPTVDASGSASRSRGSEKAGAGGTSTLYENGFDASWELDVFGAKRRAVEAAEASLQASEEDLRDVQVSLVAEVAQEYVSYRAYCARLAITETNLASQTETYAIARWRQQANLVTQLDVDQARLSLEQTRAKIPALRTSRDQAEHQLALLLGLAPGALAGRLVATRPVPATDERIAVGVPADVLRRRPDIRKAERNLAAQTAEIGVAQAARYPTFTLSGSVGLEALRAGDLYAVAARTASGAAKAGWTLFDGGKLKAQVAAEEASRDELLGAYREAVLTALKDVEDALTAFANEQARRRSLADAVEAGRSAFLLARNKYESGLIDFETVLSTQQSLLSAEDSLASSEADAVTDLIQLYKALGGGWEPLAQPGEPTKKDGK